MSIALPLFVWQHVSPLSKGQIALTFDACQLGKRSGYDKEVIEILRRYDVPATLFLGGKWVLAHPREAKQLGQDRRFEIEQHSFAHPKMTQLTSSQIVTELQLAQSAILKTTGQTPRFFRPPYGAYNSTVLKAAKSQGLRTVLWTVVTGDPDKHVTSNDIVAVVNRQARDGAVVIMHMNGRGWSTAKALPRVIETLRHRGFTLVKLSELKHKPKSAFP